MLADLAAANAGYATIKKFVVNEREINEVLQPPKKLVAAEEELRARDNHKKEWFVFQGDGEGC